MAQEQYRCGECGATFSNASELEQHNRTMHSRFTCEACGETFTSERDLEEHNRQRHPEMNRTPR